MPGWVAVIFWIWFFVSLAILVLRRVNARRSLDTGPDGAAATAGAGPSTGPTTASPAEKVWPAPPPPEPGDDTYRLDPTEATTDRGAAAGVSPGPPEGPGTSPSPGVEGSPAAPAPQATLPDLLAGITLPHELVPLTQVEVPLDLATHIIVATQKASAETVTAGLRAELEKLGYEVEHDSMLKLRARGERGVVLLEIHPDGAAVVDGSVRRFPTAIEGTVVVEIRAG